MKKERILGFDFIRAVSALLIILYHVIRQFEIIPGWDHFPLSSLGPNGDWGHFSVVALFFMLSAASLLHNYPELQKKDLKSFYWKRWKSIFPAFYLVWIVCFVSTAIKNGVITWGGQPYLILLSVIGEDGYAQYLGLQHDYYLIGEWFLGVIIILYVLYPLLLFLYRRLFWIATIGIFAVFFLMYKETFLTYIFSFWCGFLYLRCRDVLQKRKWIGLLSLGLALFFFLFPFPVLFAVQSTTLAGVFFFVFLDMIAPFVLKLKPLRAFFLYTSGLSYELFLVHHHLIFSISGYLTATIGTNFTVPQQWCFLIGVYLISFFLAQAVSLLTKHYTSFFSRVFFSRGSGKAVAASSPDMSSPDTAQGSRCTGAAPRKPS